MKTARIFSPTFPIKGVEHVSNVLESLEIGHVENVPHGRFGLFSETSARRAALPLVEGTDK
jgi:hypothetical protein